MLVIGLTGGIAAGKSTVCAMFAERGAVCLDSDRLAHEAMEPGRPAYQEIVQRFGPSV
ncbi:MAG TPA: dephospho-CoA kinase, partial [Armatimonadota bacterium]|nr:dephospho-CoA kinase [Armatimonadota bacterium]